MRRNASVENAADGEAPSTYWTSASRLAFGFSLFLLFGLLFFQAEYAVSYLTKPRHPLRHENLMGLGLLGIYGWPVWLVCLLFGSGTSIPKAATLVSRGLVALSVLAFLGALVV